MTIETHNKPNDSDDLIKILFGIPEIPESQPKLLDHSAQFSEETILQLMLYGEISDWKWYANMEKECKKYGNRDIKFLLQTLYAYIENPAYNPDNEDLPGNTRKIYNYVISRIGKNSESVSTIINHNSTATKILDTFMLPKK